jgi:hypothetical protein
MPSRVQLPSLRWDRKGQCLFPLCPVCGGVVRQSGGSFICLVVGSTRYQQPVAEVLASLDLLLVHEQG